MPYPRLPELRARVGGALFVVVACGLSWLSRQMGNESDTMNTCQRDSLMGSSSSSSTTLTGVRHQGSNSAAEDAGRYSLSLSSTWQGPSEARQRAEGW